MSKSPFLYSQPMTRIDQLNARGQGPLPRLIDIEFISVAPVVAHLIAARTLGDQQTSTKPPYTALL